MSPPADTEPRTYRGTSLEKLLPRIREELGPDAIVLRQRDGLSGGVGGFFQRRCVEVVAVARAGGPRIDAYDETSEGAAPEDPAAAQAADTAALADGLSAPAIQEMLRMASPFAAQLEAAEADADDDEPRFVPAPPAAAAAAAAQDADDDVAEAAASLAGRFTAPDWSSPERFGAPQGAAPAPDYVAARNGHAAPASDHAAHNGHAAPASDHAAHNGHAAPASDHAAHNGHAAPASAAADYVAARVAAAQEATQAAARTPAPPADVDADAVEVDAAIGIEAPRTAPSAAALAHERTLAEAGIAPALATELVGEALAHGVPFATPRSLKRLVRAALARRIPLAPPPGPGGRTIVFVGAGGSGKTIAAARLAEAYAAGSTLDVAVLALDPRDGGAQLRALLEPAGVEVGDARAADRPGGEHTLTIVDTPAVSPAAPGEVTALARQLKRLGRCEVHVAVPATLSTAAVRRLLEGLAPLKPAALVLTHLDEVPHPGPALDAAIARDVGLSYCCDGTGPGALTPADPAALAARLLS